MNNNHMSPAERAAQEALEKIYECIDSEKNFLLEAGAGSGKTYSLIDALKYIIENKGQELLKHNQQVACISYTNVASDEIASRIDKHPVIYSSTIHSFCWSLISDFQPYLRKEIPTIDKWPKKIEESGEEIKSQKVTYNDLGRWKIDKSEISLHHDDVLFLTAKLMGKKKFRSILADRFPILLIDEYQDTSTLIVDAIKEHILDGNEKPLVGLFGDSWQKIYDKVCGKIEHNALIKIDKGSNFRSAPAIVDVLNRIRPELPQEVSDSDAEGEVSVYHTNEWNGIRRDGSHWKGDLPEETAHRYLLSLIENLKDNGWDFSKEKTKILMLTHNKLATEQGYKTIADIFPNNDAYIKKENPHIAFFADVLEPVCVAYENKRFGEMFTAMGKRTILIRSHADKVSWATDMDELLELRRSRTIGDVLDHLKDTKRPRLTDRVLRELRELKEFDESENEDNDEPKYIERLRKLRSVPYSEVISLIQFIDDNTPFSTKHGVKGAEFENVLVVFGRGWNKYNFNQFLEWFGNHRLIPSDKMDTYERNRNLFYVVCSRPIKRLAVLFTHELSDGALSTVRDIFGLESVHVFKPEIS